MLTLEAWGNKLIKWGLTHTVLAPNNLPLQPTTEEIFNPTLQLEFMPANPAQSFSFSLDTTLVNMSAGFSYVWIFSTLQQNVFLATKISEEIFFVAKNTALVTKYEFHN